MSVYRQRDVTTPHFQMPFRLGGVNGGAFVNEQDTVDDIIDCVKTILAFPIGSREDLPGFGSPDLVFRQITDDVITRLQSVIVRWEARAAIQVDGQPIVSDELVKKILIKVGTSDA